MLHKGRQEPYSQILEALAYFAPAWVTEKKMFYDIKTLDYHFVSSSLRYVYTSNFVVQICIAFFQFICLHLTLPMYITPISHPSAFLRAKASLLITKNRMQNQTLKFDV